MSLGKEEDITGEAILTPAVGAVPGKTLDTACADVARDSVKPWYQECANSPPPGAVGF
jgi:hypothetical protein